MFRKSLIKLIKQDFDKNYNLIADYDLVVRLSSVSKLAYRSEILSGWRIHNNNDSFKKPISFIDEKEKWIDKVKLNPIFFEKYNKALYELQSKLNRQKMIINLIEGNKINSLKLFLKNQNYRGIDCIIIVISYLPFFTRILKYLYLRKLKNGL